MLLLDRRPCIKRKEGHGLVSINQNSGVDLLGCGGNI